MIQVPDSLLDQVAEALAERLEQRLDTRASDARSPWMTTAEAVEYTRLAPSTFREMVRKGDLRAHGGKARLFHRDELDEDLGYRRPQGRQPAARMREGVRRAA